MRLLLYGMSSEKGGKETYMVGMARELVKLGDTVDFMTVDNPMAYEDEMKSLGCAVHHIPQRSASPQGFVRAIERVLSKANYDAIWSHKTSLSSIEDIQIAKRLGVPKRIAHSHATENMGGKFTAIMHAVNRKRVKRIATDFFACSARAGEYFFPQSVSFEIKQNAFDIGRFAFDSTARATVREELSLGDSFTLCHVGRFSPEKNHTKLLGVFKEVLELRSGAILLLCGNGELRARVEEQAQELGIDPHVRFLGSRSDVPAVLSASDVLVFPSIHEGLPYALLEAQANGLPCVISSGIDKRAALTPLVRTVDLSQSNSEWARLCAQEERKPGYDPSLLAELGYDIVTEGVLMHESLNQ